ncbi:MAG: serine hydrolase [Aquabacterium sp.]|nr:serine hydrolase [Aquabacterium sp.]
MYSSRLTRQVVHSLALAAVITLAAPGARANLIDDIPAGTGYAALEICTRTMQSQDHYWRVRELYAAPKVLPLPAIWMVDYLPGIKVNVRTWVPLLSNQRTAIFRKGLGCTVTPPGTREADVRAQPFRAVMPPPVSMRPWPLGEGPVDSSGLSTSQQALLKSHGDQIFSESTAQLNKKKNTIAFLVAHQGRLIHERYAKDYQRDQPQLGWSMTKSLTAMVAGAMVTDGLLSIDAPVGLPQWTGSPKAAITWRQLLTMSPGLAWKEDYTGSNDTTEMLFSQADEGSWAADRPLTSPPGTVFNYSTGSPTIAMLRMKQLLGGSHQALYDYYQRRLLTPLGIRHGVIEPDATGTPIGGARGVLRPVDWLRLGQLIAQGGQWQGQTLINEEAMKFLVGPSSANAGYGGYIWRQASDEVPSDLAARLPTDTVFFLGHMGQLTVIVPSKQLVVVRMGASFDKETVKRDVMGTVADLVEQL